MTYQETVNYLYTLRNRGTKLGLGPMRAVLRALGNPHHLFRSVHVGGTNGKGTVSAMVAAILKAAGIRCGLYTSPHLVSFTERIVVDGQRISEEEVVRLTGAVLEIAAGEGLDPTFFEVATAAAFTHFASEAAEWVVAEVGLGGRLDATNVLVPAASVVTNVAMDHQDYLGDSIEGIAAEKAGIFKTGVPACTAAEGRPLEVLRRQAAAAGAPFDVLGEAFGVRLLETDPAGVTITYWEDIPGGSGWSCGPVRIPLAGAHNGANAALAIRTARLIAGRDVRVDGAAVQAGLSGIRWPGRVESVPWDGPGLLILDAAHNPAAAEILARTVENHYGGRPVICVVGMLGDKDASGVLAPLARCADAFIVTRPAGERALPAENLAELLRTYPRDVDVTSSVGRALARARERATEETVVLVTGSFYTVGEVKQLLGEKGCLSSLRE